MHNPRRIAPIREHPGQIVGQTETTLGHRQKHHAPIRGQATAIEGSCDFLGVNRWKREWQHRIIGAKAEPQPDEAKAAPSPSAKAAPQPDAKVAPAAEAKAEPHLAFSLLILRKMEEEFDDTGSVAVEMSL